MILEGGEYLIIGVDEADKCPVPLAMLVRNLSTHIQQVGVRNVRFILSGVSPFYKFMIEEDQGIQRFFNIVHTLNPMPEEEARELIDTLMKKVISDCIERDIKLAIDPDVIDRAVVLSGGHPAVLQLLGFHIVEHESNNMDGVIDLNDLKKSLRTICYESRGVVYDSMIHKIGLEAHLPLLSQLLENATSVFPTRIHRKAALSFAEHYGKKSDIEWLVDNNILDVVSEDYYGLTDEFLHVRMRLDSYNERQVENMERAVLADSNEFASYEGVQEYLKRIWSQRYGFDNYYEDRLLDSLED
jgi:hypothetical protein